MAGLVVVPARRGGSPAAAAEAQDEREAGGEHTSPPAQKRRSRLTRRKVSQVGLRWRREGSMGPGRGHVCRMVGDVRTVQARRIQVWTVKSLDYQDPFRYRGTMARQRSDLATPTLMRAARGTYARSIRAHLQAIGVVNDLPKNGAFILSAIDAGGTPRADLPAGLGVSKQAISQAIDVLVNRGYLDRSADQSDRRRITLELTDRGHEVVAAVWLGTEAIERDLATRVSPEVVEAMRAGLMALGDIKAEVTATGSGRPRPARRLQKFSPIFPVRDMESALAHYASLGFKTFAYEGGDDYGFANRDGVSIHLELGPAHDPGSTYLNVGDADALFEEWSQPGIGGVTRTVGLASYGLREGSHVDPDGNLIRFGSLPEE